MDKLLSAEVLQQVKQLFEQLDEAVQLLLFVQSNVCTTCADQQALLSELAALSDKLSLDVHPLESRQAIEYNIDKVPATVVRGVEDHGIRFYGLTSGYEFTSLLEAIELVSHGLSVLDPSIAQLAALIRQPTHLQTLVTLSCPYCPKMIQLIHQLAYANELIRADMIDAGEYPQLVNRYEMHGVPLTVVNGQRGFEGALPPDQAVLQILKIVDPDLYEQIDAQLRQVQGLRHSLEAVSEEIYDVIVVGAGPAGLTAALYSQRKGRKTALIGKKVGGQLNDTSMIENYPGLVQVGGADLAQAMRRHVETYPVAERCHTQVESISRDARDDNLLKVVIETDEEYRGRSLIYCAGKSYRRLNVPGEDHFIGRGVAWCATCDAPLFKDKQVAVVGGGNSAFTAVRDLLRYTSQIHLIHSLAEFQADPVLVEEIKQAEVDGKVHFHMQSQVREYLGGEHLEGVRLSGTEGEEQYDLAVAGVFLEIGLEANSNVLAPLVALNEWGEVPVNRHQATELPGLFAAGDVTDEMDKQIVIAAGAGAKAALAADRYLTSMGY
ncbi:MAG: FAD-dependent oxidoreductase [Desulfuromonas sp.]|nr:FAD-dependent oxidoreductase [Desulfuromonas sp.]